MEGIRKSRSIDVEIMVAWDQIRIRELYNTKQRSNHSIATLYCCTTYSGIQQRNSDDIGTILACRFMLHMCVSSHEYFFIRAGTKMRSAEQVHLTFPKKGIVSV